MQIELLPTWMLRRHLKIWKEKGNKPITFNEVANLLPDDERVVAVFLSKLNKMGWVDVKKDINDARRRLYVFHSPQVNIEKCMEVIR